MLDIVHILKAPLVVFVPVPLPVRKGRRQDDVVLLPADCLNVLRRRLEVPVRRLGYLYRDELELVNDQRTQL